MTVKFRAPQAVPAPVLAALTRAAERHNVPLNILIAIAWIESEYNAAPPDSAKGAQGMMQLIPATQRELGVTDPYNIDQSAQAAALFLRIYYDAWKLGWQVAVAAFCWGPGHVRDNPTPDLWPPAVVRYVTHVREAARMATALIPFDLEAVQVSPGLLLVSLS